MKNLFLKHGPKLMFVLVLALAGCFTYFVNYESAETVMASNQVPANIQGLTNILIPGRVSAKYPYNTEHAAKLKDFAATAKANQDRPTKTTDEPTGVNENYPLPARPKSQIFTAGAITQEYATLDEVTDVTCHADQGVLYVSFKIPDDTKLKNLKLVRAEIFRGEGSADKIDTATPYGKIELGPEEAPAPGTVVATTAPATAPATAEPPIRRPHAEAKPKPGTKPKIPEAMKWVRGFKDTQVDQKVTYFYKVRLVGRLTVRDGELRKIKVAEDKVTVLESILYHAPQHTVTDAKGEKVTKTLDVVPPSNSGSTAQLYATSLSKEVHATAPTNYKMRLAGVHGTLPPADKPRDPNDPLIKTYEGSYEVILWIKDAQDWISVMTTAHEGEMIGGIAKFKVGGEPKTFDFTNDLGYKMLRIDMEEDAEAKINPKPMIETATVLNVKTKKEEKFPKAPNIQRRNEWLNQLDSIISEQAEQNKANDEKKKAAMEKNKAEAETRRAAQPPPPATPPQ